MKWGKCAHIPYDAKKATDNAVTRDWLRHELATPFAGKIVVISHHATSPLSTPEWRRKCKDELNPAYANDWTKEAFWSPDHINLWVHGHIHQACDNKVNGVQVACNPKGYGDRFGGESLINNFNPWLVAFALRQRRESEQALFGAPNHIALECQQLRYLD